MNSMKLTSIFRRKTIEKILSDAEYEHNHGTRLVRNLNVFDLTAMAIAAIIGAGIFSTIGNASADGGPAVSLLFVFTAVACSFSAMCYAEFASRIPISGSAYTYAYVSLGELIAWIIGWTLLMEYSVGNIAVAISWSEYLTSFLSGFHIVIPQYLTTNYLDALRGHDKTVAMLQGGIPFDQIPGYLQKAHNAWVSAPTIGSFKVVANIPAFMITAIITALVYVGIKESKSANNIMVGLKILVVLLVIAVGSFYVTPANWNPFAPNGVSGVLKGISAVFFAYIGFDAISTTAEECKNPQRDLPRAMIISLAVCTVLYIGITLVLTGMVNYNELAVGDPLAFVFQKHHLNWLSGIISFSAIIAMASVLLVFQLGQPRIWMSMSRDGLLPPRFSAIHPRFKTPGFATIITGLVVGIPSLFMNLTEVTDLTSIGTLFAFVVVCAGVLHFKPNESTNDNSFRIPYVNGKYIILALYVVAILVVSLLNPHGILTLFQWGSGWDVTKHKLPYLAFLMIAGWIAYRTYRHNYSLIPVLGLVSNLYLMTELGYTNWIRFTLWLLIGLVIYFTYSYKKSKLAEMRDS
jgi:basic amino acid/polyamine antiporter, APA family